MLELWQSFCFRTWISFLSFFLFLFSFTDKGGRDHSPDVKHIIPRDTERDLNCPQLLPPDKRVNTGYIRLDERHILTEAQVLSHLYIKSMVKFYKTLLCFLDKAPDLGGGGRFRVGWGGREWRHSNPPAESSTRIVFPLTWQPTCGIKLTWIQMMFSRFTRNWNCLKASTKGMPSMSPITPPSCHATQMRKRRSNSSNSHLPRKLPKYITIIWQTIEDILRLYTTIPYNIR